MTNPELIDSGCGGETKIAPASLQCGGSRTTKDQLAQVERLNGLTGRRPKETAWLVEVRPDEELPADFCVSPRCILVPTALDKASAVALDYASALARRFGSELALLYAFEGSDYAQSSRVEAKLWACFSTIWLRHLKARVLLRPGPTGEQVATVANALSADLIVTSSDYHHRFLSYFTHAESGILRVQGIPCPVVLVNPVVMAPLVAGAEINASFITGLDSPFGLVLSCNDLFPVNSEAGTVNEITDMIWGSLADGHGAEILMPK